MYDDGIKLKTELTDLQGVSVRFRRLYVAYNGWNGYRVKVSGREINLKFKSLAMNGDA
jgi:hypothetical protein